MLMASLKGQAVDISSPVNSQLETELRTEF